MAENGLNVHAALKWYINAMIHDSGPGMKVLLMDKETTGIVSMVFAQSEISQKEVYLFEQIEKGNLSQKLTHLKCIVFLRPTKENIDLLAKELKSPRYGQYYIYFTSIISKSAIKFLAEADEQEVVRELQEFFADYYALGPDLFSLNLPESIQGLAWNPQALVRTVQGLASVLLATKKHPVVRYQGSSNLAKKLAEDVKWTYQAMVHELLTVHNNRVSLASAPGISKELTEIILSPDSDEFYKKKVRRLIASDKVRDLDASRLVVLYALRYEKHSNNDITGLVETLRRRNVPDHYLEMIYAVLEYGGSGVASKDLLGPKDVLKATEKLFKVILNTKY
nr:EOG090X03QA [Lepidurus arcticus]